MKYKPDAIPFILMGEIIERYATEGKTVKFLSDEYGIPANTLSYHIGKNFFSNQYRMNEPVSIVLQSKIND